MKVLSATELHAKAVQTLGLDHSALDMTSVESIAAAIRRAAGLLCPCPERKLISALINPLAGLVEDKDKLRQVVEEILEALISYGDLLEHKEIAPNVSQVTGTLIYRATPSFVVRKSGAILLIGVAPDNVSFLTDELENKVEYSNHVRRLPPGSADDLSNFLVQIGLVELSHKSWLKGPKLESPEQHLNHLNVLLDQTGPAGEVQGLTILDITSSVLYYRGRWKIPKKQSGRFVGRRKQLYGADLWCYAELIDGLPQKIIDLPLAQSKFRGCDEAWRLQAAIDVCRKEPQRFRKRAGPNQTQFLDIFSPVPMWAKRRWDSVGEPVLSTGCLFTYQFPTDEIEEELDFLRDSLWLTEMMEAERK